MNRLKENRPLADFLPTLTIEHVQNNTEIRNMLGSRGIKPEDLPPAEDIKKLERKTKTQDKKIIEKSSSFAGV